MSDRSRLLTCCCPSSRRDSDRHCSGIVAANGAVGVVVLKVGVVKNDGAGETDCVTIGAVVGAGLVKVGTPVINVGTLEVNVGTPVMRVGTVLLKVAVSPGTIGEMPPAAVVVSVSPLSSDGVTGPSAVTGSPVGGVAASPGVVPATVVAPGLVPLAASSTMAPS